MTTLRTLHAAIKNNDQTFITKLNGNVRISSSVLNKPFGEKGDTPLQYAIRLKRKEYVVYLAGLGADCNLVNNEGETALLTAVKSEDADIVRELLIHGNINNLLQQDFQGRVAVNLATINNNLPVLSVLFEAVGNSKESAELMSNFGSYLVPTPLESACSHGNLEMVRFLLEQSAKVNREPALYTALYLACKNGHLGVVSLLIEHGANLDYVCCFGMTALHIARQEGYDDIAELLIKHGANQTLKNERGRTAEDIHKNPNPELLFSGLLSLASAMLSPPPGVHFRATSGTFMAQEPSSASEASASNTPSKTP